MANVKQVKIGTTTYDVEALHFIIGSLDTPAQWKSYIDNLVGQGLQIVMDTPASGKQEPATAASASTMGKLYMVQFSGQTESGTYTEFVTVDKGASASPRYVWEKIGTTAADLTDYVKKDTNYSAAAKGAGGHSHTVSVPTVSVDATKKLGATASGTAVGANGTAAAVTSYPGTTSKLVTTSIAGVSGSATASKATAGTAFNAIKSVSISSEASTATGRVSYIASVSTPSLGGTTTFNTDAIKDITLAASDTSSDGPAYISAASGTFVTSAIKNVKLTANASTSTGAVTYVESVSGSAPSLTGTKTFVTGYGSFSGGSFTQGSKASWSASVDASGILSFSWSANGNDSFTAASLGTATTGTVGISGGSYTPTTKYLTGSGDAAATGSISTTTKYMKHTNTSAGTGTVSISGGGGTTKYLAVSTTSQSVTPYTFADVTVPQAAAAITVATGALSSTGSGSAVMTGLGTAVTATVLTGVKVTADPTITITEATTNTGPVNEHVTTGANTATTSSVGDHTHDVQVNS